MPLYIPIANYGNINLEHLRHLYGHHLVQRLRWLLQLSEKMIDCPSATQNRLTHSVRVTRGTEKIVQLPEIGGNLPEKIKKALAAVALAHDTPHSPLSHTLEPFYGGDHENENNNIVNKFELAVELCGIDYQIFAEIFTKQHPAHKIISDKNFGTDKLDYLKYDAIHSGVGNVPDTSRMKQYLAYRGGQMMAHINGLEEVKELQRKYLWAYQNLYCTAAVMLWQRVSQKIMSTCIDEGLFTIKETRWWTDNEFFGRIAFARVTAVQELYQAMKEANVPVTIMQFLIGHHPSFRQNNQDVRCYAVDKSFFERLNRWKTMEKLYDLESEIAKLVGIEPWQVLFASQDQTEKRFIPTDATIFTDTDERFSLFGLEPEHYDSMLKTGQRSMFANIAIIEKSGRDAAKAQKAAAEIRKLLEEKINS